ncbi:hypothetical protein MCETHM1_02937 [Flavobacteriaceae bacterium]|jgi:hypothetical protein
MKQRFYNRILLITAFVLCSFSCSSDLDFEQANDFSAQPIFTTNLAYFDAKASYFESAGGGGEIYPYIAKVDFFDTSFIKDNLIKTDLYFRIKNTIARGYIYNVTFLDINNAPIKTINIPVAAYTGTEILIEYTEIFDATSIDILKNTKKMVFSITILPGTPLIASSPGRIEMSSSITAYFDVK